MTVPVLIAACTEDHRNCTVYGDMTKINISTVGIIIWKSVGGKTSKQGVLRKLMLDFSYCDLYATSYTVC